LRRSSKSPAFARYTRSPHLAMKPASDLRRARVRSMEACLRPPHIVAQDAFDRIDAQSCDWTELVRDHCSFTRPSSAPFRATRACLPCPGRAAAPPYSAPPWLASRLTLIAQRRCFSPISATDIPIRAPVSRPIPAPAARAAKSASQMSPGREPHAIRSAASDHLAAIRPRVELRLTAPSSFGRITRFPP
jgi:hypothetical protein